jgi:hypothetical protein
VSAKRAGVDAHGVEERVWKIMQRPKPPRMQIEYMCMRKF